MDEERQALMALRRFLEWVKNTYPDVVTNYLSVMEDDANEVIRIRKFGETSGGKETKPS